jgi:hypothetical protein
MCAYMHVEMKKKERTDGLVLMQLKWFRVVPG